MADTAPAKKRGRPKKNLDSAGVDDAMDAQPSAGVAGAPKRELRTRKTAVTQVVASKSNAGKTITTVTASASAAAVVSVMTKRTRGARAAKYPVDDAKTDDSDEDQQNAISSPKKRARKPAKAKSDQVDGNSSSSQVVTQPVAAPKKGRGKAKKVDQPPPVPDPESSENEDAQPVKKTVVLKGKAPVDDVFSDASNYHVFCDEDVWDAALNQTNITGNNNKYYMIQLLEHDQRKELGVLTHWGRVGATGQHDFQRCRDLEDAKRAFCKKFTDKTKNKWELRENFVHHSGKYDLVQRDYSNEEPVKKADEPDAKPVKKEVVPLPDSKLHPRVQELMMLIFNIQLYETQAVELEYDCAKAPLGKLTKAQVTQGYASLKKIESLMLSNDRNALVDACNEYYTRIPHAFGMRRPPLIETPQHLKREMDLLELLGDIEVAMRALDVKKSALEDMAVNPIDHRYLGLKIDLNPVDQGSVHFGLVKDYLQLTHGPTHDQYTLELLNVFEAKKDQSFSAMDNRMLLWHGSRLSNFVGILSQGLRIAPPEAPVTGYMFGKGVYFADVSTKSANYCYSSPTNDSGLMLLCEVALGKMRELYNSDYDAGNLPPGYSSTKGMGRHAPNPKTHKKLEDGIVVPVGKCIRVDSGTRTNNPYVLDYNEYIVYNTAQVRLRYLLQVRFNYKRTRYNY